MLQAARAKGNTAHPVGGWPTCVEASGMNNYLNAQLQERADISEQTESNYEIAN